MKPALLRPLAKADLSDQAEYLAEQAGELLANEFVDCALHALETVEHQPGIGSPRWNPSGQAPVLRSWRIDRFRAVWLYFEQDDRIDVVRLLGERQDITKILRDIER